MSLGGNFRAFFLDVPRPFAGSGHNDERAHHYGSGHPGVPSFLNGSGPIEGVITWKGQPSLSNSLEPGSLTTPHAITTLSRTL